METMNVYSMTEIYKKADEFSRRLHAIGEVEFIQIGVLEKGGVMVLVHYEVDKKEYSGSFRLETPTQSSS